ncbi:MAG: response regulator transcription factor [Clostridiales bacterium]|nr:response regulator transcription factor [Clostridiales bacterium]
MLQAVIVDDEHLAIEELNYLLSFHEEINVINTFTNPVEAKIYLKHSPPDLVFLDIQMPRKSGLEIARTLLSSSPKIKIIFVTAYDSYAIEAFSVNAIDYLLKPTSRERLDLTLERVIVQNQALHNENLNKAVESISNNKNFITLYSNGIFVPIKFNDIIYCQSDEGLVTIITEKQKFNYSGTLSNLEEIFTSPCFFRCHRSYIINIEHVEKIEPTERTYIIKMKNIDELIPVSRSNTQTFKKIMSIY